MLFEKLLEHADIRSKVLQMKKSLIGGYLKYLSPDEIVKELNKLIKTKNKTQVQKDKMMMLMDKLLELQIIDKEQHRELYHSYID